MLAVLVLSAEEERGVGEERGKWKAFKNDEDRADSADGVDNSNVFDAARLLFVDLHGV